ncbi:MAG TPA: hypothetical protein VF875_08625 [Anaeromyxobacter sp.]
MDLDLVWAVTLRPSPSPRPSPSGFQDYPLSEIHFPRNSSFEM